MRTQRARFTKAVCFLMATLLAVSLAALAPPPVAHADTITVTANSADVLDAAGGDCTTMTIGDLPGPNGETSLREAICAANNTAGADTITLPAGTYTLTVSGHSENSNASGDLDLTSDITINGDGADTTIIDANQLDRVLQVFSGATVELNNLTLTNGQSPSGAVGEHCFGGGVYNNGGVLTIRDSVIRDNITQDNSGFGGCFGGGVDNSGTLTIERSAIRDNTAGDAVASGHSGGDGGGVYDTGALTIRDSLISGNATGDGAGSGFDGDGGGVYANGGTATIENSTISGNAARGYGGGVRNYSTSAAVTLIHSTITDNTADADNDDGSNRGGDLCGVAAAAPGLP